jgi:hypothetical protein
MGRADYFAEGQWNVHCDRCGRKMKSGEVKKTYDGYYTCDRCWYPRHPQEFNRGMKDDQSVPFVTQEPSTIFLSGYAQLANGSCIVSVPSILSTSTVVLTNSIHEGIIGTVSYVITAGSGFTMTSTSNMDMSSYSYSVTV